MKYALGNYEHLTKWCRTVDDFDWFDMIAAKK